MMRIVLLIVQLAFWPGCSAPPPTSVDPRPEPVERVEPDLAPLRLKVYYFTASWCSPCQKHKPTLTRLMKETEETDFLKVDVDKNPNLVNRWNVPMIPTYVVYYAGEEIHRTRDIYELQKLVRDFEQ